MEESLVLELRLESLSEESHLSLLQPRPPRSVYTVHADCDVHAWRTEVLCRGNCRRTVTVSTQHKHDLAKATFVRFLLGRIPLPQLTVLPYL
jgi:hypothetical protein